MKLRKFGFFHELRKEEAVAVLRRNCAATACKDERLIVGYLESGTEMVSVGAVMHDLLDAGRGEIGPCVVYTDGVWLWTSDVIHYVSSYRLRVPDSFAAHMECNGWRCPKVRCVREEEFKGRM